MAAGEGFYDDVVRELELRIAERLATFEEMHLVGADYFVSAIGPAFEVFARYSKVVRLSGEEVGVDELMVLARQAVARHAIRRLLGGENLGALDSRSLMYLTWRWAYDGEPIPADEAYKLGRAFDIDLTDLARPGDLISKSGDTFKLLAPHERKDPRLTATPSLIDVLQIAARYHDAGRRNELAEVLGATGMGAEPGFWATAAAIAESLPDGNRERTMLLGLTGSRDQLAQAASKHQGTSVEELTLFGPS
jgi:adenine-specific DNA methylase